MIDMTITVLCDECGAEKSINLEDGPLWDSSDIKIERALQMGGWYLNMDGEWCPKCAPKARQRWEQNR